MRWMTLMVLLVGCTVDTVSGLATSPDAPEPVGPGAVRRQQPLSDADPGLVPNPAQSTPDAGAGLGAPEVALPVGEPVRPDTAPAPPDLFPNLPSPTPEPTSPDAQAVLPGQPDAAPVMVAPDAGPDGRPPILGSCRSWTWWKEGHPYQRGDRAVGDDGRGQHLYECGTEGRIVAYCGRLANSPDRRETYWPRAWDDLGACK